MTTGTRTHYSALSGYAAVVMAAVCWATSGIFIKLIMTKTGISATSLAFWRDTFGFLLFLSVTLMLKRDDLKIPRSEWWPLAGMGISLGLFHVGWNLGVFLNGAAITTVQQAAMPAIVLLVSRLAWNETLNGAKISSMVLIFIGTVLISGITAIGESEMTLLGLFTGFSVPVTYAGWSLFGKKMRSAHASIVILTYAFGVAALVLLPFQFFVSIPWPVPGEIWLWFPALIILSTAGGFFAFTFSLGRLPAGVASTVAMSEILFVSVFAYFFLGEFWTPMELIGAALIIGGVVLLVRKTIAGR